MTGTVLPVYFGRSYFEPKTTSARTHGKSSSAIIVLGLLALSFSTNSRAETIPAVTESSVPQLRVHPPEMNGPVWSASTLFNSMAAVQAAYPPGENNGWTYQLSNYGDSDSAFWTDVQPLPGCGNCYTEPLLYLDRTTQANLEVLSIWQRRHCLCHRLYIGRRERRSDLPVTTWLPPAATAVHNTIHADGRWNLLATGPVSGPAIDGYERSGCVGI